MKKRLLSLLLAAGMTISLAFPAYADEESDLKQQKAAAEAQLNAAQDSVNALAAQQQAIQSQISDLNADIVDLMVQIDEAQADIDTTQAQIDTTQGKIEETEDQIDAKENEIQDTKRELKQAETDRDQQYEDMAKRVQYFYENGGKNWATSLLESKDMTSFFNKSTYADELQTTDRQAQKQLEATVAQVTKLEADLQDQKAQLVSTKDQLSEQKNQLSQQKDRLSAQKAALDDQNADLQNQLNEKKAADANYSSQIATARSQAKQISSLIRQQQERLNQIEEEKREAARRAAEEAARQEAARQEAARQEAARQEESSRETARRAAASEESASRSTENDEDTAGPYSTGSSQAEEVEEAAAAPSGGGSGSAIVSYAEQFLGNPYVWGGSSLTHGADCSHFVWLVLRDTIGYSGGYTTSGGWASRGRPVSSLAAAQAGDVIVYSGHVAIYDGNGMIVEAKGSRYGITHDRRADCKSIVAIRRFV